MERQVFGERFLALILFFPFQGFDLNLCLIVAKEGSAMDEHLNEGEQKDFPLNIRSNQFLLVEELKSKFENIDRPFDTLFERMNDNENVFNNPVPKTMISNSDSQVIPVSKFLTF